MRALRFACAVLLANAFVLPACSDSPKAADTPDASSSTLPPPAPDAASANPDPTTSDSGNNNNNNNPDSGPTPPADAGNTPVDAGPVVILDAGPDHEGGIACVAGGTLEVEPNDTPATANTLDGSLCGEISPGTESDFLKFTLKAATTMFRVDYNGNITLTFRVNGQTVTWGNGSFPPLPPFAKGTEYSVEVKSADGSFQAYRVTLTET